MRRSSGFDVVNMPPPELSDTSSVFLSMVE
jgi:hypothetical protein